MPSIFEPGVADQFITRLSQLKPDAPARWGKFNATKMVAHINDSMRMATGELPVKPKRTPLKNAFMRWLVIYVAPFPRGAPTAPELLARCNDADFSAECARFKAEVAKLLARANETRWPEHPAFGAMSRKDWGTLGYKHTDHHFKQFGI